jgi:flagellar biosynthesis component FlhA
LLQRAKENTLRAVFFNSLLMVTIITVVYALAALASACAAVLAWVAKIRWASEYKEAKEAQIEQWKDMASTTLLAEFRAAKELWEEISRIKDQEIERLKSELATWKTEEQPVLSSERQIALEDAISTMRDQLVAKFGFLEQHIENLQLLPDNKPKLQRHHVVVGGRNWPPQKVDEIVRTIRETLPQSAVSFENGFLRIDTPIVLSNSNVGNLINFIDKIIRDGRESALKGTHFP